MPRTKTPPLPVTGVLLDDNAVAASMDGAEELGRRLAVVEEQFGDGEPFHFERSAQRCEALVANVGEALLQLGRELIRIKEHVPHGEFGRFLEGRLQIDPRTAQRAMQAAWKFGSGTPRSQLAGRLSRSKLLTLMTEDDAALDDLAEGGTVAGHKLDELETMTNAELRDALRRERQYRHEDADAHEELLASKNLKIDEYAKRERGSRQRITRWQDDTFPIAEDITVAAYHARARLADLCQLMDFIQQADFGAHQDAAVQALGEVLYHSVQTVVSDAATLGAEVDTAWGHIAHQARPLIEQLDIYTRAQVDGLQADELEHEA